jgi:uncharacterized protein YjbJ (UPF0337 family)
MYNLKESAMNKLTIKANWNEIAGKAKQKFATMINDELLFKEGKERELLGILQKMSGQNKQQIRNLILKI